MGLRVGKGFLYLKMRMRLVRFRCVIVYLH